MALKGTLKDFGIGDILQLIGQQQKTGVLHLSDQEEQVHVSFKDGKVVKAEVLGRKRKELLGDMLVRAGMVGEKQLEDALEEQKRTLKRLGDILVARGTLTRDSLRDMALLQTTETVYRLFFWKAGDYEFEAAEVPTDPEMFAAVRLESLLMEGFRRVDEWPLIRKKISGTALSFVRLGEPPPAAGLSRGREGKGLGDRERLVYDLACAGHDVQAIVDRSRLGEFEACKALFNVVNLGCLAPAAGLGAGADLGTAKNLEGRRLVALLARLAAGLLFAALLALAVSWNLADRAASDAGRHFADSAGRRLAGRAQLSRIEAALDVFALERGALPESLEELSAAGILAEDDLRYPWEEAYHYRKTPDGHVLLPPLP